MKKIEKIIKKTPLNGILPKEYYNELSILNLSYGEYLHYSEKEYDSIFYLIDGVIQFKQTTQDGIDLNYGVLDDFYFVGEKKLLSGSQSEMDFYILRDNTKILKIPIKIAKKLMENQNFKIYMLELHSNKLFKLIKDISILHFKGVDRFLAYNISNYSVNGIFKFKNMSFLSILLSIDRKSLYNSIKKLENQNLIKRGKNIIEIKDRKGLEEYVRF
jgi:CRP-like cAMP-binding protein